MHPLAEQLTFLNVYILNKYSFHLIVTRRPDSKLYKSEVMLKG